MKILSFLYAHFCLYFYACLVAESVAFAEGSVPTFGFYDQIPRDQLASPEWRLSGASTQDPLEIALSVLRSRAFLDHDFSFTIKDWHRDRSSNLTHVYARQLYKGTEIVNGDANVNIDGKGRVMSFCSTFYRPKESVRRDESQLVLGQDRDFVISPVDALAAFTRLSNGAFVADEELNVQSTGSANDEEEHIAPVSFSRNQVVKAVKRFIIAPQQGFSGRFTILPIWSLSIEIADGNHWYDVDVDARSGKILQLMDRASEVSFKPPVESISPLNAPSNPKKSNAKWIASRKIEPALGTYRVYPMGVMDPYRGDRALIKPIPDETASPVGWHTLGHKLMLTTIGNNVFAQVFLSF